MDLETRSSGCRNCDLYAILRGSHFRSSYTRASFAFAVIPVAVLLVCLCMGFFMKWHTKNGRLDRGRTPIYIMAVSSTIVYYILKMVDTILTENITQVKYSYTIMYIFFNAMWRISEIAFLALTFRTVRHYSQDILSAPSHSHNDVKTAPASRTINVAPRIVSRIFIALISTISIAGWALYVAYIAIGLNTSGLSARDYIKFMNDMHSVNIAYFALYLIASLLTLVGSIFGFVKQRSSATICFLLLITIWLVFRTIFSLVIEISLVNSQLLTFSSGLSLAQIIIYAITVMLMSIGYLVIGWKRVHIVEQRATYN